MRESLIVSSGTLRTGDLVAAFRDYLISADDGAHLRTLQEKEDEYVQQVATLVIQREAGIISPDAFDLSVDSVLHEFLHEVLFDLMDLAAPESTWFGAHPDDGACFGYWPCEDDHYIDPEWGYCAAVTG